MKEIGQIMEILSEQSKLQLSNMLGDDWRAAAGERRTKIPFPNMPLPSLAQPCAAHTESISEWKGLWCQAD